MNRIMRTLMLSLVLLGLTASTQAELYLDGFVQGLYGGRLDEDNPTATEQTASETRMQLRAEHFGDRSEFFGRLDFIYDGAVESEYDWELREAFMKFRPGGSLDFKIGRQILTWGTGDLIFINDNFAKDYRSFFVGRDDQYLKAPQNALRMDWYGPIGALALVWTPSFEPNRLPTGSRLSYYHPFVGEIVGADNPFDVPTPDAKFENGEVAMKLSRYVGGFNLAGYFYHGFYKNPTGAIWVQGEDGLMPMPVYPELSVYGASLRGPLGGWIVWLEGGYLDSRNDPDGDDPMMPNSSLTGLAGIERQIVTNLTINLQYQADYMFDHETYEEQQTQAGAYVRDEIRHLVTSRVTKLMMDELLTLSAFGFFSPSDEDWYLRASASYKYSDEVTLAVGGNFFHGENASTEFGQFQLNDNVYLKATYGF